MSDGHEPDDLHIRLMLSEPTIAKLTVAAVAEALDEFPLQPKRGMAWLARAIQGALYVSLGNASDGPERQSNTDNRAELERLSQGALKLWGKLAARSDGADSALWRFAWHRWDGEGGKQVDGISIGEPSDYRAFGEAVRQLEWLAAFVREAAKVQPAQAAKWRQAERREIRVWRAHCLSPIFETAFGVEAAINTWPGNDGGPWRDFYQRIVALAFNEKATPDWEGVLDEARRRHKTDRVTFADGVIPDYHP
jgi:hypothetical protein